ncbi:hypothetical protein F4779DRAFT_624842 [Xylariaceae sp. FL0662B]|nr:hypothetical protein F4779DRAFT_624842 [Xylariaceae sp. FL0662B]
MESTRPGVDLEKELTCSICTDILYQPLTLLDCLHTFCGSCLKDWFDWQQIRAENSPYPPTPSSQRFTCPSCRAPVRDTRHNATVNTLLEMFLAANPDKAKSEEEKEDMRQKYKPEDNILPQVQIPDKSPEQKRIEEVERQMLEQARELSLRDAGVDSAEGPRVRRRRDHSQSEDGRNRSDRESSRDRRHRDSHDRTRRDAGRRRRAESNGPLQPESSSDERRRHRSESQVRSRDPSRTRSRTRRRHIEHQASIRSLISSSDVDSRDLEREIDEFARQIQEEGLLDGLDVDDIDLNRNDELSQKITEAYRRRQRGRARAESTSRSNASSTHPRSDYVQPAPRPPLTDVSRPSSRRRSNSAHSAHTRPSIAVSQLEVRSRPPLTSTHLDIRADPERRRRRRTSSSSRSTTEPTRPRTAETRPATRSQTDLALRSQADSPIRSHSSDPSARRPSIAESRSSSMPTGTPAGPTSSEAPRSRDLSFSERASAAQIPPAPSPGTQSDDASDRRPRKASHSPSLVTAQSPLPSLGLISSPTHRKHHQRSQSQFYPEPSITCSRCNRPHIEYELHYNCSKCAWGEWNLCLNCYRAGKGCLHWLGFGYAALRKWERARAAGNEHLEPSHPLTPCRYEPPNYAPGGAEGRRTLTTEDPVNRLESGMFCARCLALANECYWRCEVCNEGDWGFCNNCVNQGYSCTHPLLPLTYVAPASAQSQPGSPRCPRCPQSATLLTGPDVTSIGDFRPLTFATTCDICRNTIPPTRRRYHCSSCTSTVVPDTRAGDYDICVKCYNGLVSDKRISDENGHTGWRRCLNGHRMAILGFTDNGGGQRRTVIQDVVGGRNLQIESNAFNEQQQQHPQGSQLQKWWWYGPNGSRLERLVTMDVAASAPELGTDQFPPDGGAGLRAVAKWSWYPEAESEDELMFPRGAEVREIEDVNGDWFFGCYMGAMGLFPAPYVRVID